MLSMTSQYGPITQDINDTSDINDTPKYEIKCNISTTTLLSVDYFMWISIIVDTL